MSSGIISLQKLLKPMNTEILERPFTVDIQIADPEWTQVGFDVSELAEIAVRETLFCTQFSKDCGCEVSILLAHNDLVQTLNREYRGKDKPTNVLSFESDEPGPHMPLGDIILARETLIKESEEQLKPLKEHFIHLIVHGTLHLLGFDHEDEEEAENMETMEIWILQRLGIKNPYLGQQAL